MKSRENRKEKKNVKPKNDGSMGTQCIPGNKVQISSSRNNLQEAKSLSFKINLARGRAPWEGQQFHLHCKLLFMIHGR